jgi:hypothetical protein
VAAKAKRPAAGSRASQDRARAYLRKQGKNLPPRTPSNQERIERLEQQQRSPRPSSSSPSRSSGFRPRSISQILPGNPATTLLAGEVVAIGAIVTYDMLQNQGTKLPRPGPVVAALGFYALLALVGSLSQTAGRVAGAVGAVLALTILVTGKRGQGILGLLKKLTDAVGLKPKVQSNP